MTVDVLHVDSTDRSMTAHSRLGCKTETTLCCLSTSNRGVMTARYWVVRLVRSTVLRVQAMGGEPIASLVVFRPFQHAPRCTANQCQSSSCASGHPVVQLPLKQAGTTGRPMSERASTTFGEAAHLPSQPSASEASSVRTGGVGRRGRQARDVGRHRSLAGFHLFGRFPRRN